MQANFDDGAMKEVMSSTTFQKIKHRLGTSWPSSQLLHVANRVIIKSEAKWKGRVEVNGVGADVVFEVFDRGGKWDFFFGKGLFEAFKAVHDYHTDEITLYGNGGKAVLCNQAHVVVQPPLHLKPAPPICIIAEETQLTDIGEELSEVDIKALRTDTNLFTRETWPHKPECVQELLQLVTIGDDLSNDERQKVCQLINSFADIFALSISEVKVVENAVHHLDIPPDATFSMKVHQKPLTPPQRKYLYDSIETMLEAGIIKACKPEDVKCISATTLAQKAHQGKGLSLGSCSTGSTMSVSLKEWNPSLIYHPEQHPLPTTPPLKTPNGGYAKISHKSTSLQKSHQFHRETSEQNSNG